MSLSTKFLIVVTHVSTHTSDYLEQQFQLSVCAYLNGTSWSKFTLKLGGMRIEKKNNKKLLSHLLISEEMNTGFFWERKKQ